jgi:hypothetical protein
VFHRILIHQVYFFACQRDELWSVSRKRFSTLRDFGPLPARGLSIALPPRRNCHSQHTNILRAARPNAIATQPKRGPANVSLADIVGGNFSLTFEHQGLRARAVIDRRPSEGQ